MTQTISPNTLPTTVVVASGHPLARVGIATTMKRGDKFALLAEAHTGPQAVDLVAKLKPELLILEVELGGLSPANLLEKCRAAHPAPRHHYL